MPCQNRGVNPPYWRHRRAAVRSVFALGGGGRTWRGRAESQASRYSPHCSQGNMRVSDAEGPAMFIGVSDCRHLQFIERLARR